MSELLNGDTDDSSRTWDDKTKGFVFTGVNMSFAWVRVSQPQPLGNGQTNSEKGLKRIYAREHKLNYYHHHLGEHFENKKLTKK